MPAKSLAPQKKHFSHLLMDNFMELKGISLHYHPKEHFIEGKFTGVALIDTGAQAMQAIIATIEKHNCPYVFFDVSETLSMLTTAENFEFATSLMEMGFLDDRYRWSIYYKADPHIYEMLHNVIKMQSIAHLYIDNDKESAMKWLMDQKNS